MSHLLDISSVAAGIATLVSFCLLREVRPFQTEDKRLLAVTRLLCPRLLISILLGQIVGVLLWNL